MNARIVASLSCLLSLVPASEAAFPPIKLQLVCEHQINSPVAMVAAGDGSGRMFIADQRGKIRIFRNGMLEPGAFLDLGAKVVTERAGYDERGLLGVAFHPGYANVASPGHRRFYVFYIANSPAAPGTAANPINSRTVVAEYKVSTTNPDQADASSERILLTFDKPQFNHAGGGLEFGPDGFLYFSVGDGGGSQDNEAGHTGGVSGAGGKPATAKGNAQDLTNFLGKIHRIDPLGSNGPGGQYGIPASNPFAASPNGERPEIYAFGLRNTWRFTFDSRPGGTNRLFAADVGQGEVEEIDIITNGGNYGWRNKEGTFIPTFSIGAPALATPAIDPIAQYAHPGIVKGTPALPQYGISCTGGYVYRGSAIPGLAGKYVFGDYSQSTSTPSGPMLGLEETSPGVWSLAFLDVLGGNPINQFIQGFGQDESGELYVLARRTRPVSAPDPATGFPSGRIYKIVPVPTTTNVQLSASKDNTIFSESGNSNGAGPTFFAGTIANSANHRRALIAFNLSPVPAGATIASATLTLTMDKVATTGSGPFPFNLHKLSQDWGQGTANAGLNGGAGAAPIGADATWAKPFFNQATLWTTPGGDFSPASSARTIIDNVGDYQWSSPQMAYELNAWLATPTTHFGWMVKVENEGRVVPGFGENGGSTVTVNSTEGLAEDMPASGFGIGAGARIATGGIDSVNNVVTLTVPNSGVVVSDIEFGLASAKRFLTRESSTPASRPRLSVNYVPAPALTHRQAWEAQNYFVGEYINDSDDNDHDELPTVVEYAWGLSPKTRNTMGDGITVNGAGVLTGTPMTITWRRDPLATDLTYQLQGSGDLLFWTTLAQSVNGGVPTGPGYQSESEIPGQAPFRNVIVTDTAPAGSQRFFRLKVTR